MPSSVWSKSKVMTVCGLRQLRAGLGLAPEAGHHGGVRDVVRVQQLQRHLAPGGHLRARGTPRRSRLRRSSSRPRSGRSACGRPGSRAAAGRRRAGGRAWPAGRRRTAGGWPGLATRGLGRVGGVHVRLGGHQVQAPVGQRIAGRAQAGRGCGARRSAGRGGTARRPAPACRHRRRRTGRRPRWACRNWGRSPAAWPPQGPVPGAGASADGVSAPASPPAAGRRGRRFGPRRRRGRLTFALQRPAAVALDEHPGGRGRQQGDQQEAQHRAGLGAPGRRRARPAGTSPAVAPGRRRPPVSRMASLGTVTSTVTFSPRSLRTRGRIASGRTRDRRGRTRPGRPASVRAGPGPSTRATTTVMLSGPLALQGPGHQAIAGLLQVRLLLQDLQDLLVGDRAVQAVRADQDDVAPAQVAPGTSPPRPAPARPAPAG